MNTQLYAGMIFGVLFMGIIHEILNQLTTKKEPNMRPITPPPGMEQQIQFVPIPKPPVAPKGRTCSNCMHWRSDDARRVVQVQGGGQAQVSELIKAGIKLPSSDHIATVSMCTYLPMWNATTDDHWCAQFALDTPEFPMASQTLDGA